MIDYLLCIALGAAIAEIVFYFTKKPTNVFTSRYQRMSEEARKLLIEEYMYEMGYWGKILESDVEFVSVIDKHGAGQHYSERQLILKLKTFAVQRIDAIQDIMEEIEKAS